MERASGGDEKRGGASLQNAGRLRRHNRSRANCAPPRARAQLATTIGATASHATLSPATIVTLHVIPSRRGVVPPNCRCAAPGNERRAEKTKMKMYGAAREPLANTWQPGEEAFPAPRRVSRSFEFMLPRKRSARTSDRVSRLDRRTRDICNSAPHFYVVLFMAFVEIRRFPDKACRAPTGLNFQSSLCS